jgi:hypothetical protein
MNRVEQPATCSGHQSHHWKNEAIHLVGEDRTLAQRGFEYPYLLPINTAAQHSNLNPGAQVCQFEMELHRALDIYGRRCTGVQYLSKYFPQSQ